MEAISPDNSSSPLEEASAVKALALAQAQRLRAFRALVVAGPNDRANFAQMNSLLAYLTDYCCEGRACEASFAAVCLDC
jgi:ArsR family transcriptional regulator